MEHTGKPPLGGISWPATMILLATAVASAAIGVAGFRRRNLDTK